MLVFDIKDVYIGGADLASDGIVKMQASAEISALPQYSNVYEEDYIP